MLIDKEVYYIFYYLTLYYVCVINDIINMHSDNNLRRRTAYMR